jgi:predicted acyltransferase
MTEQIEATGADERLVSLDFFRGFTMFMLVGEWTVLFGAMVDPSMSGTIIHAIGTQLHHHPWHGLHFWDLIQPFFMFIVGVAIPLSVRKRSQHGDSDHQIRLHAIKRSVILFVLGWALYCIMPGYLTLRFQNVLAQLGVTYIIAFFLMKYSWKTQFSVSILILVLVEIIYRTFPVPGFDQPFTPDKNFGAWFDLLVSGELSDGHWVSFNAFPTAAHTIWGVMTGQLLLSDRTPYKKLQIMVIAGLIGVICGFALDYITPIIKRISTSSFVIYSGGWTFLALAFSYWLIDIKKHRKWVKFLVIIGMNPLFIYVFAHVGGADLVHSVVKPFTMGLFNWAGQSTAEIVTGMVVWFCLWYITYWMYRRKIFIKI